MITLETDKQFFITNHPSKQWAAPEILKRILLHWDTETGVFGIKDRTFQEDKIRYLTVAGTMSHVGLLNISGNCLNAEIFNNYWEGESLSGRIQFWKDNPYYNPFGSEY